MSQKLLNEIPPGAYITVTLKGGLQWTGFEDTHDNVRAEGILRMTSGGEGEDTKILHTEADNILCFEMAIIED